MAGRAVITSGSMDETAHPDAPAPALPRGHAPGHGRLRARRAPGVPRRRGPAPAGRAGPAATAVRPPTITVLAVGARNLHVIATAELLPAPQGQEVELTDALGDADVAAAVLRPGHRPGPRPGGRVRRSPAPGRSATSSASARSSTTCRVPPGGGLSAHHALHAGTGLAHAHAAAHRDFDSIAALAPTAGRPGGRDARCSRRRAAGGPAPAGPGRSRRRPGSSATCPCTGTSPEDCRRSLLTALREVRP